ncbi:hypothetical protein [uncultured Methanobrevibacter sp.]|uniref:hypothetical protein n=1 Tax=uncultured Methanobrevibacter sp. TaxID=253161 RepID=UPI0025EB55F3|nr:hypothetical protein [uncultured Methanobrevibacter sp.]
MSLYSEYLEARADVLSKELKFRTEVSEWFNERGLMCVPIDIVDSLTMDHFTITTDEEFKNHLEGFEKTFMVQCIRIHHTEIITFGDEVKHTWKFHFRERKC